MDDIPLYAHEPVLGVHDDSAMIRTLPENMILRRLLGPLFQKNYILGHFSKYLTMPNQRLWNAMQPYIHHFEENYVVGLQVRRFGNHKDELLTNNTAKGVDNPLAVTYNFAACTQEWPKPEDGKVKYFVMTDDPEVVDKLRQLLPAGSVLSLNKTFPIVPTTHANVSDIYLDMI